MLQAGHEDCAVCDTRFLLLPPRCSPHWHEAGAGFCRGFDDLFVVLFLDQLWQFEMGWPVSSMVD
jgi:hypothetical protein